jgi:hypothetical protein
MAGNGNSGSKRDKVIRDALTIAVNRIHEGDPQGRRKLALAAAAIVEKAVEGDIQAFNTIADRIDGKPHQSITAVLKDAQSASDAELLAIIAEEDGSDGIAQTPPNTGLTH